MQLTKQDLTILKNFASINQSIKLVDGTLVRTKNTSGDIHGYAELSAPVQGSFCIYDLPRFIRAVELFDEPVLSFGESSVTISGNGRSAVYAYSPEELLEGVVVDYDRQVRMPPVCAEVIITEETLTKALRAASILTLPEVLIKGEAETGSITLSVCNYRSPSSDRFDVTLAGDVREDFELLFDAVNLKMISQDYTVQVTDVGLTHWIGQVASYYAAKKDV